MTITAVVDGFMRVLLSLLSILIAFSQFKAVNKHISSLQNQSCILTNGLALTFSDRITASVRI